MMKILLILSLIITGTAILFFVRAIVFRRRKRKIRWQPWNDFEAPFSPRNAIETLPIREPPCKTCYYFQPKRTYRFLGYEIIYDGVLICSLKCDDMMNDFSCYRPKI